MSSVFSASQNQKVQGSNSDKISKVGKEWQEEFLKMHLLHHCINDFLIINFVSSHQTSFCALLFLLLQLPFSTILLYSATIISRLFPFSSSSFFYLMPLDPRSGSARKLLKLCSRTLNKLSSPLSNQHFGHFTGQYFTED